MYKNRIDKKIILSLFITLLFLSSLLVVMAPVMAAPPAEEEAPPAPEPVDTGSRAPEQCTSRTTGWSITGTHTYTGTCTISGGSISIQNGADITFEALTLTASGSYYMYVYGSLTVLNSTIKGSSTTWRGIYASNNPYLKFENSNVQTYYYYGVRAYYTTKVEIGNSTFDGANSGNYGVYVYFSSGGYVDNNTMTKVDYYGIYAYQSSNVKFRYNTVQSCTGSYGVYLNYFSGVFENNTVTCGNSYSMYIRYNQPSSFADNKVINGRGVYIYNTQVDAYNCVITGNTGQDVRLSAGSSKLRAYDTLLGNKLTVDSGTSIEVYWRANVTVKWLSDNGPVQDAELTITDALGTEDDRDLMTDSNGERLGFYLMEYSKESSGTKDRNPYWINATKDLSGQSIYNSSQLDIDETANNVDLILDDVPPWLVISAPEEGFITNLSKVTVSGKTEKNLSADWPVTLKVRLGSTTYLPNVDQQGNFQQEVALKMDGKHEIDITAYDFVLNEVSSTVNVIRDTVKPPLTIDTPADETLTNITTITVAGTTEPGGTIYVNEVEVTVDSEGGYTTEVDLAEGDNLIRVKARDVADNWDQATVLVELDTKDPILLIAEPLDHLRTNEANIRVLGTTEQKATVKVNNNNVILAGTSFQTQLTLNEGDNTIHVLSCDVAGNCNQTYIHVYLDTIVPPLTVTSPENEFLTNQDEVEVTGTTESGAEVTVAGRDADLFGTDWSYTFTLREGKNSIKIEAKDEVGNKAIQTLIVHKDTKPPDLYVTEPENGATVNTVKVMVSGTTEANAMVKVNDEPVSVISAMFNGEVSLKEGENEIEVTATDLAGNIARTTLLVTLDTSVGLDVDDLDASVPLETTESTINISGMADPDAKVYVNEIYAQPDKNGYFTYEVDLELGENQIVVEANDPLGNKVTQTYTVTRNEPPPPPPDNPIIGGSDGPLGGMLLPLLLIIVIIVIVMVLVAVMSKKKKARLKAEEAAAAEQAQEQPAAQAQPAQATQPPAYVPGQATYAPPPQAQPDPYTAQQYQDPAAQNGYSGYETAPAPAYAMATAAPAPAPEPQQMSNITPEAQQYYNMAEQAVSEAEAAGRDVIKNKRHMKIANMFVTKGNSEKVIHYSKKAMEFN